MQNKAIKLNKIELIAAFIIGLLIGIGLGYPLWHVSTTTQASYIDKIKARGKLIMGTSADWPPFEYVDKNGNFAGIDIEIAKRIAQALGVQLEVKDMQFSALIEAVKNGMVDIVLADMTPTSEREQVVDFSFPYYFASKGVVVTLKSSQISSIQDLYGKSVGVQTGTIQEEYANQNLQGKAQIKTYDKVYPDMVMVLQRGDVDAIIIGEKIAGALVVKNPDLKIAFAIGKPTAGAAVAMPKGAGDLKVLVDKVIEDLINSGEMDQIFLNETIKWLGGS
ncbi:MAG: transporter substrate-binding domain-containing protein [Infirmifilum sp.]